MFMQFITYQVYFSSFLSQMDDMSKNELKSKCQSRGGELEILIQGSLISQLTGRSCRGWEFWELLELLDLWDFGVVGFVGVFGFVEVFGSCCTFDFVLVPPTVVSSQGYT